MLRIATINIQDEYPDDVSAFESMADRLQEHQFDILCCLDVPVPEDAANFNIVNLAEALGMTCSFAASPEKKKGKKKKQGSRRLGKAILTGQDCCMLSSGIIPLAGGKRKKSCAQFAVVRKDGDAVLICNMQLQPLFSKAMQREQMQTLFEHQIMEKQYAAIVFCGEFGDTANGKWGNLFRKNSRYKIREGLSIAGKSFSGSRSARICVLEERKEPVANILFSKACCLTGTGSGKDMDAMIHGASLDMDITRIQHNDATQIHRYVSFLRPWTGPAEAEQGAAFQPAWLGHTGSLGLVNNTGC
jgi:hypothetical protein